MGTLTKPGAYPVRLCVTDGELEATASFSWTVKDHNLPDVFIDTPEDAGLFLPGSQVRFAGWARDYEGALIPPQALSWELYIHHNQHMHFGGLPKTIGPGGSFVFEDHSDNVSFELCLLAVDAA